MGNALIPLNCVVVGYVITKTANGTHFALCITWADAMSNLPGRIAGAWPVSVVYMGTSKGVFENGEC
jgi:hypothetical protein